MENKNLIEELKKFDNFEGYKQEYEKVRKDLEPVINQLVNEKEENIDSLHALLKNNETWSCLFALEILGKIGSEKSIPVLIDHIIRKEGGDYEDSCEFAMAALKKTGEPAIDPLMKEVKELFDQKKFSTYLVEALTGIKSDKVYNFMKEVVEDYIENEEKYDEWFHIESFTYNFDVQEKKEILPLLRKIIELERTSKHERIEIEDTIEKIEDPEGYEQKIEKEKEKLKPLMQNNLMKDRGSKDKSREEIERRMSTPDDELEIQFKCHDCNRKQNIHPGLITQIDNIDSDESDDENVGFCFENEILCKFCSSNNLKPTGNGKKDIMIQGMGTIEGSKQGVFFAGDNVLVENKKVPHKDTYEYIKKKIREEPTKGELYLRAGNIARKFNKYEEAIKHYKKAIELNPKLIGAYINLTEIYEFRHNYYNLPNTKSVGIYYLYKAADIFMKQNYDDTTIKNTEDIVSFLGETGEALGVRIPGIEKVEFPHEGENVGRNKPCPCGSGKKYKKCCLKNKKS